MTIVGLKSLTLDLPPSLNKKAIASVLSSLDDKIDLLHRQNKTIEAMAEALFRHWFVERRARDQRFRPCGPDPAVNKSPDVILFLNGLPLVVIELKNPVDEDATVRSAFRQLQTYKQAINSGFHLRRIHPVHGLENGRDRRGDS